MTQWTEGRVKGFITSTLRKGFTKWPPKWEALKNAYVGKMKNELTGRQATFYQCAICKTNHISTDVQVDHVEPVVPVDNGFTTWDNYITNLFCDVTNLQVVCKKCHKIKSKEENTLRKANK